MRLQTQIRLNLSASTRRKWASEVMYKHWAYVNKILAWFGWGGAESDQFAFETVKQRILYRDKGGDILTSVETHGIMRLYLDQYNNLSYLMFARTNAFTSYNNARNSGSTFSFKRRNKYRRTIIFTHPALPSKSSSVNCEACLRHWFEQGL